MVKQQQKVVEVDEKKFIWSNERDLILIDPTSHKESAQLNKCIRLPGRRIDDLCGINVRIVKCPL